MLQQSTCTGSCTSWQQVQSTCRNKELPPRSSRDLKCSLASSNPWWWRPEVCREPPQMIEARHRRKAWGVLEGLWQWFPWCWDGFLRFEQNHWPILAIAPKYSALIFTATIFAAALPQPPWRVSLFHNPLAEFHSDYLPRGKGWWCSRCFFPWFVSCLAVLPRKTLFLLQQSEFSRPAAI